MAPALTAGQYPDGLRAVLIAYDEVSPSEPARRPDRCRPASACTSRTMAITGTGLAGSTNVTVHDDALNTTIALLNQYANQFAVDAHAYSPTADNNTPNHGTAFQLASPV